MSTIKSNKQKKMELRHKKAIRHRFGNLATASAVLAIISTVIAAFAAGYGYATAACAAEHSGASAPAYMGLISAVPFLGAAVVFGILFAIFFYNSKKKSKLYKEM